MYLGLRCEKSKSIKENYYKLKTPFAKPKQEIFYELKTRHLQELKRKYIIN